MLTPQFFSHTWWVMMCTNSSLSAYIWTRLTLFPLQICPKLFCSCCFFQTSTAPVQDTHVLHWVTHIRTVSISFNTIILKASQFHSITLPVNNNYTAINHMKNQFLSALKFCYCNPALFFLAEHICSGMGRSGLCMSALRVDCKIRLRSCLYPASVILKCGSWILGLYSIFT